MVAAGDARDDCRRIFGRPLTVNQHFEIEAPALRPLPAVAFDPTLLLRPRVDTKSRVCVRQCFYSVPVRFAGGRIDVRLGAERVEALIETGTESYRLRTTRAAKTTGKTRKAG